MSQPNKPQFECLSCGKHFAWKPEIAGKKAKCTCGATVQVPMSIEVPPPPEPEDDLIDFKDEPEEKPARRPAAAAVPAAGGAASECPICLETIPAGHHLCPSCGYDIAKSGHKVHAAKAAVGNVKGGVMAGMPSKTATVAAPAPEHHESRIPQIPRRQMASAQPDTAGPSMAVKVGLPLLAILVLGGAFFGFKHFQGGGAGGGAKVYLADDEDCERMIREDNGEEINEWLKTGGGKKMVLGMTLQQAEGWARNRYQDGAKKVYAFAVVSTHLVVELPDEKDKREKLIRWQNQWAKEHYEKPYKDVGQKYMLFKMSL